MLDGHESLGLCRHVDFNGLSVPTKRATDYRLIWRRKSDGRLFTVVLNVMHEVVRVEKPKTDKEPEYRVKRNVP